MIDSIISNGIKYRKEIFLAIFLIFAYLVSRLIVISDFPIFTDEAIYVRWTQIAANDAGWRFISLTDGKQPMFVWVGMIFVKLFEDPLTAVRLVSVLSGFLTLLGLFALTRELFKSKKSAFLSSVLYICYPFAVVYDRLALYDSMVAAFAVWAIYFSVLLVRKIRLDVAYTLGFALGGGLLTKSSAIFSIYLLPLTILLFDFKHKYRTRNLLKWIFLAGIAVVLSEVLYNFLRFSPFFHIITEKNAIFVYPISEWLEHPFTFFQSNFTELSKWLFQYLTPFYLLLIAVSAISKKFIRERILLILYFLLPFAALALFGKTIFPRFIFFMSIYLLPLAAFGLNNIIEFTYKQFKKRGIDSYLAVSGLIVLFFVIYPLKVSLDFIFNPAKSTIAEGDVKQYITEWPSGGGIKESVEFFENEAKDKKIFIATEGTFGLLPYALDIYLGNNKNITTKGYWPIEENIPEEVITKSFSMSTYFIFYQPCPNCQFIGLAPKSWPLELIKQFKKSDVAYLSIYKVKE